MADFTPEGAIKPSSLEVDAYDKDNAAYRTIAIQTGVGGDGNTLINMDADIPWDRIVPVFNSTSDVYTFSKNSVQTGVITVTYTDATKNVLSGVTKAF